MLRRVTRFSVALTAVATVAACGANQSQSPSSGSSGSAATTSTTTATKPPPPIVAPAQLQPGKYPTAPHAVPPTAGTAAAGAIADAQRLASHVVGPWAVDPALTQAIVAPVLLLDKAATLGQLGPKSIAQAAESHRFVNGFASTRNSAEKVILLNAVLQFASPDDANQAATDMNSAATATAVKGGIPKPLAIAGHPETLASTYQVEGGGRQRTSVRAFTPAGPFVLMQFAQDPTGQDSTGTLVAKSVDAQRAKLEGFKPVDAGALADVPLDPSGLLAMTLMSPSQSPTKNAEYLADAALHFQMDPNASAKTFKDNGITEVAMGLTNVFRAADPWAAVAVVNTFANEVGEGAQPADAVPGLPLSKCASVAQGKQFYCVAPAGDYAVEAYANDLQDAHEQVAAQYILLTAPKR
jgi:hypothetical protein